MRARMSQGSNGAPCPRQNLAVGRIYSPKVCNPRANDLLSLERNFAMYLAVSTLDPAQQPNQTGGLLPDLKGSLQLWSVSPDGSNTSMGGPDDLSDPAHSVTMRCEVVLCFDGGPVIEFKWMPLGCFDKVSGGPSAILLFCCVF